MTDYESYRKRDKMMANSDGVMKVVKNATQELDHIHFIKNPSEPVRGKNIRRHEINYIAVDDDGNPITFLKGFDPLMCFRLQDMGDNGYSISEACAELGISTKQFAAWANPENGAFQFAEAVQAFHTKRLAYWERAARVGVNSKEFNAALYNKYMAAMFGKEGWSEKMTIESTGETTSKQMVTVSFVDPKDDMKTIEYTTEMPKAGEEITIDYVGDDDE